VDIDMPDILTNWPLQSLLAIIAGVVILLVPRVLNYAIALYLLAIGALGLLQTGQGQWMSARGLVSLIAGVLILIKPTILNYVIGIYLIFIGLLESGIIRL
jgi:uncharacterized membrane protein HdeD (DUF308 family)